MSPPAAGDGGSGGQRDGQRHQRWSARLASYARSLRWTPIPLGVGFALIAYQQYRRVLVRERKRTAGELDSPVIARPWEVSMGLLVGGVKGEVRKNSRAEEESCTDQSRNCRS